MFAARSLKQRVGFKADSLHQDSGLLRSRAKTGGGHPAIVQFVNQPVSREDLVVLDRGQNLRVQITDKLCPSSGRQGHGFKIACFQDQAGAFTSPTKGRDDRKDTYWKETFSFLPHPVRRRSIAIVDERRSRCVELGIVHDLVINHHIYCVNRSADVHAGHLRPVIHVIRFRLYALGLDDRGVGGWNGPGHTGCGGQSKQHQGQNQEKHFLFHHKLLCLSRARIDFPID